MKNRALSAVAAGIFAAGAIYAIPELPSTSPQVETVKSVWTESVAARSSAVRGGTYYGLFVGVNKYAPAMEASSLSGCVNDVYNAKDAYTDPVGGKCSAGNAIILTDSSAKYSTVRDKFQSLAAKAVSGDVVLYEHSSHGGLYDESSKGAFICAYDDYYLDTEFADDLALFKSGVKVIVVLDTCHSGAMFRDASAWNFARRVQTMVDERIAKSGNGTRSGASIGWITAANWDEPSSDGGWYDNSYGHAGWGGAFTFAFLEGWTKNYADSNNDGILNFKELFVYSRDNCKASSAQSLNESVLQSVIAKGSADNATYITVDGESENIKWTYNSGKAQSDHFALGCNGAWTVTVYGSWIRNIQPSSGTGDATVYFTLDANTQAGQRTGSIVIASGSLAYTITIVQPSMTPITVTFDGNGGKPGKQNVRIAPGAQWYTAYVDRPSRSGYIFNGWWTDKTGGENIDIDSGICSFTANTTLYAHWLKQYTATANGGMIYLIQLEGGDISLVPVGNRYTFFNGEIFAVYPDDKAGQVFSHWTSSADKFDLGEGYAPRDKLNLVEMPEANISLTANYLTNPGYITVNPRWTNPTDNDVSDADLEDMVKSCQWSVDGKTWTSMKASAVYPVKTGSVTVSYRSKDPRWLAPPAQKITADRNRFNDLYPLVTRVSVVEAEAAPEDGNASGSVTLSPANGQVVPGKQVVLTAKPGKDSVFAYWESDEGYIFPASLKLAPSQDAKYKAVFKHKATIAAPVITASNVEWSRNSMVGVAFEMAIGVALEARPAKFSASGLPPGLKIDPQSGIISGIPSKPGSYTASVTVTSSASSSAKNTRNIRIDVNPLPDWAKGSFSGIIYWEYYDDEDNSWYMESGTYGSGSFTVAETGKISGKISQYGTNSTFTALSYDAGSSTDGDESEWILLIRGEMKTGKTVKNILLAVQQEEAPNPFLSNGYCYGFEDWDGYSFMFWRNMWQDKDSSYAASQAIADVKGLYTMSISSHAGDGGNWGHGWLSTSIPANGTVKTTGKLADGTAISITSPLLYDPVYGGYFTLLYGAPSSYKGGSAFFMPVFDVEGDVFSTGISQWTNFDPAATSTYGEGFRRSPGFVGYWYNPSVSMSDLDIWDMVFSADQPALYASSLKYTYYNDYGIKTTVSLPWWWDPVDTSKQIGNIVYANYSGTGFITGKATKPVQTGGKWVYQGKNDAGLTITFNPATGVFKGTYTFWYDYWKELDATSATPTLRSPVHTSKKVNFEGVLVWNYNLGGFFTWDDVSFYIDPKTGKEKSYKFKQSCKVGLDIQ